LRADEWLVAAALRAKAGGIARRNHRLSKHQSPDHPRTIPVNDESFRVAIASTGIATLETGVFPMLISHSTSSGKSLYSQMSRIMDTNPAEAPGMTESTPSGDATTISLAAVLAARASADSHEEFMPGPRIDHDDAVAPQQVWPDEERHMSLAAPGGADMEEAKTDE